MSKIKKLAIVVAGGPAPGINGVIRSVTIEAINSGLEVLGILDGFKWLVKGNLKHVKNLKISGVARIQTQGGSILRLSRVSPIKDEATLKKVIQSLKKLEIDYLVIIGGDGSAQCSYKISQEKPPFSVVHVPKTIDNDIPLPGLMPSFGFHTARHYGTEIVNALMEDAKTSSKWYFVVSMGRKAGHLALGIGKAAGATMTLIGEEFENKKWGLSQITDVLETAIIRRLATGRSYGVVVMSEGLSEFMSAQDLEKFGPIQENSIGQIQLGEINLARILRDLVENRMREKGIDIRIIPKDIGYELRCMPPVPFDQEYTMDLGYAAVKHLLNGGNADLISIKRGGRADPIPLEILIDEKTGTIRNRLVDIDSDSYKVALSYMIRFTLKDKKNKKLFDKIIKCSRLSQEEFLQKFDYLIS